MPVITPVITLSLAFLASASPLLFGRAENAVKCDANNLCSGVESTTFASQYICGDSRLGPLALVKDKHSMKGELGSILDNYRPFGEICPAAFLQKYGNGKGWFDYPPKDGFELRNNGEPIKSDYTLCPGDKVDRVGHENGTFLAPLGTPYEQRSLVPANLATNPKTSDGTLYNYHVYEVIKNLTVEAGPIAPWFEQPGNGIQYHLAMPVWQAVRDGFLVELCKPATWVTAGECAADQHCKLHPANNVPFCEAKKLSAN
ncbi:hemagluttinin repeat family protein [Beauveria brongniartii RCEF 3172]|uniref:Hemagluttinin repeat family protein n=1 Tax=Beauveria brongniartii RCEF 3172 TaxID=1081107 RepID=A0A166WN42_9HYPO|nr:hemagluttinin repeat family protein [Beauveria brongniartii RCEF 3172]